MQVDIEKAGKMLIAWKRKRDMARTLSLRLRSVNGLTLDEVKNKAQYEAEERTLGECIQDFEELLPSRVVSVR